MKKNTYIVIIILIIVVLLTYLVNKNKDNQVKNVSDTNTVSNTEEINKQALSSIGVYNFNTSLSSMEWQGKKTLIKDWVDTGTIGVKSGSFEVSDGSISKGNIVVDMNSIKVISNGMHSKEDMLEGHLKSDSFFDVANFPTAEFVIKKVEKIDDYNYNITGNLTIKGITKEMTFGANIYESLGKVFLNSDITVDRSMFDVKFGSTSFFENLGDKAIDNDFTLKLKLVGEKE